MVVDVVGEVIYWRGPAPFYFVRVPEAESKQIKEISSMVTYGWGCLPCKGVIGETEFTTALIPREGMYMVPLKVAVRKAEGVGEEGEMVAVRLEFELKG